MKARTLGIMFSSCVFILAEQPQAQQQPTLIESRYQSRSPSAVGIVLGSERFSQQPFFGMDTCEERRDKECGSSRNC